MSFTGRNSVIILCLVTGTVLAGQSVNLADLKKKAEELYRQKQYEEALELWYSLETSGQIQAGLYYNIGIAESSLRHTDKAMLAFEKAIRLKPLDKKIIQALAEERKKIENGIIAVEPFFLEQWYAGLLSLLRPAGWAMTGLLLVLCIVWHWVASVTGRMPKPFFNRQVARVLSGAGIVCLILGALAYAHITRKDEAIVQTICDFRQAPSEESPKILTLHSGEKVMIKDQIGNWKFVQLLNLDEGWIKADCIQAIQITLH